MSEQYPGGFITKSPPTPNGPYETDSAYGIWNLSQQAAYQAQGLWPTAGSNPPDPQFNYVTMLLHGDGTNGAQNNTFTDSSTNAFSITRNGNTTQGSFSPYGDNWSNYFANAPTGTSGIYVPDNAAFTFGSGDFTVEAWINSTYTRGGSANAGVVYSQCANIANNSNRSHGIQITDTSLLFYYTTNGSTDQTVTWSTTFNLNTWYHIAIARSGNTIYAFVNGVLLSSQSFTATIFDSSASLAIGSFGRYPVDDGYTSLTFPGYISNFRIVKGTALYTASFTPSTTPLTAISGTALLTCQSNRFVDNSSNAFAITTSGTPSVQRFNPFGSSTEYSTATIGGSGYFSSSSTKLNTTSTSTAFNFGTGDYSVEYWLYLTATPGAVADIVGTANSSGNTWQFALNTSNQLRWQIYSSVIIGYSTATAINLNSWNHVVICRQGTTCSMFINGTRVGTTTDSTNFNTTEKFYISQMTDSYFTGYMSDVRICNGTSAYTASSSTLTVPTAPLTTSASNTVLLMNMTNAAISDNAMMNDLETAGNAQISTSVKKYGTGSMYFDGAGDYLLGNAATNELTNFGTGDFTIELWFYRSATSPRGDLISRYATSTTGWGLSTSLSATADVVWYHGNTVLASTAGSVWSTSTWNHVAVVRSSGATKIYVNGVVQATLGSDTTNYITGNPLVVGAAGNTTQALNGYIDDLRITKGYARYTANFTPPTAALPNLGPT